MKVFEAENHFFLPFFRVRYGWYKFPCGDHVWLLVALGDSVETCTSSDHTFIMLVLNLCAMVKNVFFHLCDRIF